MGALMTLQEVIMSELLQSEAWKALDDHRRHIAGMHMRDMFAEDGGRF